MILSPTYREVYRFLDQEVAAINCMGVVSLRALVRLLFMSYSVK